MKNADNHLDKHRSGCVGEVSHVEVEFATILDEMQKKCHVNTGYAWLQVTDCLIRYTSGHIDPQGYLHTARDLTGIRELLRQEVHGLKTTVDQGGVPGYPEQESAFHAQGDGQGEGIDPAHQAAGSARPARWF